MKSFLNKYRYFLLLHFIIFIWGFTGIFGGLITIGAVSLVWYRMLIAVIGVAIFAFITRKSIASNLTKQLQAMSVGLIIALHWIFFYQSIKSSTISIAVVCLSFATFFSALIEPLFYKRRILIYEVFFGLLVVLCLIYIFSFQTGYQEGILFGVFSASLSALFTVLNGKLANSYEPITLSFYELIGGFFGISIFLFFSGGFDMQLFIIPASDWIYLLLLGIICTAFAFVGSVYVMKQVSPYTVVISTNLEPVYTIILAYLIFGEKEKMNVQFYIGTIIILLTLLANAYFKKRAAS